jgi:hypothetical protein
MCLACGLQLEFAANPYIFQQHPALAGLETLLDLNTT